MLDIELKQLIKSECKGGKRMKRSFDYGKQLFIGLCIGYTLGHFLSYLF